MSILQKYFFCITNPLTLIFKSIDIKLFIIVSFKKNFAGYEEVSPISFLVMVNCAFFNTFKEPTFRFFLSYLLYVCLFY